MGGYHAAATLLVVSGAVKAARPRPFESALVALGWSRPRGVGRLVGAMEVVVGATAVVAGGRTGASAVAVAYVAFAAVVVLARRRGVPSCGCFGSAASPPVPLHVVVDLAAAALAATAVVAPAAPLSEVLAEQPWAGLPYLGSVGIAVWLTWLVSTRLAWLTTVVAARAATAPPERIPARARLQAARS